MGIPTSHHLLLSGAVLLSNMICAHDSYASPRTCSQLFSNKSNLEGKRNSALDLRDEKRADLFSEGMIIEIGGFLAKHPAFGADKRVSGGQFRVERVKSDGSIEVSRWEESNVRYEESGFQGRYDLNKDFTENAVMNVVYRPPKLKRGMIIKMGTFTSINPAFGPNSTAWAGTFRVETVYGDGSLRLSRWEQARFRYESSGFAGDYFTKANPQLNQVIEVVSE